MDETASKNGAVFSFILSTFPILCPLPLDWNWGRAYGHVVYFLSRLTMKCPATPSEVELMKNGRGVYERYIGKTETGKKRWRFGNDEATAKVTAWETWQRWENRPQGIETWEALDIAEKEHKAKVAVMQRLAAKGAERAAMLEALRHPAPDAPPIKTAQGVTMADAKRLYLASLQKRVGLIGSLGLTQWTVDQTTHKLNRALSFLPARIGFMSQLDYPTLENLIYRIAARPLKLANPTATEETKRRQVKEQVSQRTAIGWISEVKAFLLWCAEEDTINFVPPRHASSLFKIRPEAEEQVITTITQEQLKLLWQGSINNKAHNGDNGKRRRLFIMLGLNCGFYGVDIATLKPEHIITGDDGNNYIWKLRRKTRKTNAKLARTKWYLWKETKELLDEYMPLNVSPNQIRLAFERLVATQKLKRITHSNLRDTGAVFMEKVGSRELADTYLAHSRGGVIDSYSHPDWDRLSDALQRFYDEFVKPAIG